MTKFKNFMKRSFVFLKNWLTPITTRAAKAYLERKGYFVSQDNK